MTTPNDTMIEALRALQVAMYRLGQALAQHDLAMRQVERTRAEVAAARAVVTQLDEEDLQVRVDDVLANRPADDDHDFGCDSLRDDGPIVRTGLFPE
jgi:hypothetical protein